jgi:hypothetical protein
LTRQLRFRFGKLPDGLLRRIRDADEVYLERWAERVLIGRTLDAVFAGERPQEFPAFAALE